MATLTGAACLALEGARCGSLRQDAARSSACGSSPREAARCCRRDPGLEARAACSCAGVPRRDLRAILRGPFRSAAHEGGRGEPEGFIGQLGAWIRGALARDPGLRERVIAALDGEDPIEPLAAPDEPAQEPAEREQLRAAHVGSLR